MGRIARAYIGISMPGNIRKKMCFATVVRSSREMPVDKHDNMHKYSQGVSRRS